METLKRNPKLNALIIGYTDKKEKSKLANTLSTDRGHTVWKYLVEQGIDRKRLTYKGYGALSKYSSKTDEGRELNRRVEIILSY